MGLVGGCADRTDSPIGIVDPFLKGPVAAGERFWLVIYPRTITSLRHVWAHPAFDDLPDASRQTESEQWMADYADQIDVTVNNILEAADDWVNHGDYFMQGGKFEGVTLPEEFWGHYESIRGREVDENDKECFFSCSC